MLASTKDSGLRMLANATGPGWQVTWTRCDYASTNYVTLTLGEGPDARHEQVPFDLQIEAKTHFELQLARLLDQHTRANAGV